MFREYVAEWKRKDNSTGAGRKRWRADKRCGGRFRDDFGNSAICYPWGEGQCCSKGHWCGGSRLHCMFGGVNYRPGAERVPPARMPLKYTASELRHVPVRYVGCSGCRTTLILARVADSLEWLEPLLPTHRIAVFGHPSLSEKVPDCIGEDYYANWSTLNMVPNAGDQHTRYLAYIIQEYDRLPERMIFLHAEHHGWHDRCGGMMDGGDKVKMIQGWPWDHACIKFFPSYCKHSENEPNVVRWVRAHMHLLTDIHVPQTWTSPCCAQFAVHRDQIRSKPWGFYARLYDHAVKPGNYPVVSEIPGVYFEMLWVLLLGSMCQGLDHCKEHASLPAHLPYGHGKATCVR